jgi:hypothetical protein
MPLTSIANSSARSCTLFVPGAALGQWKRPFSNRF